MKPPLSLQKSILVNNTGPGTSLGSISLSGSELVDDSSPELACRYFVLEQNIELAIGTTFRFGETEEGPGDGEETDTGPKVS